MTRLLTVLKYATLVGGSLVVLMPLVTILLTSLKTPAEMAGGGDPLAMPSDWTNFDNYVTAFTNGRMLTAFANTAVILVVSVIGTVLVGTLAAYAIDRFTFPFKKLVVGAFLVATLVPGVTTQVTTFQVVDALGA